MMNWAKNKSEPTGKKRLWGLLAVGVILGGTVAVAWWWGGDDGGQDGNPPASPAELSALVAPEKLEGFSKKERSEYLRSVGARMAALDRKERRKMFRESDLPQRMDEFSHEDRRAFRRGMWEEMKKKGNGPGKWIRQRVNEFFEASPEKQQETLDRILDRISERSGRRGRNRDRDVSDEERKKWMRRMLNVAEPETRARVQEFFRRLGQRADERGIELPRPGRRR